MGELGGVLSLLPVNPSQCTFVQMTDTDVAFLLYCRSCSCDRHDLYLPSIPASLQTLGRCECAVSRGPRGRESDSTRNKCKECGGASICQHHRRRNECKECGGAGTANTSAKGTNAMSAGGGHLPAPAPKERVQGVRRGKPLPSSVPKEPTQGVRGGGHMPAPAPKEPMQGVRGGKPLPASAPKDPMQGVPQGGGHVNARGGVGVALACACQCLPRREQGRQGEAHT